LIRITSLVIPIIQFCLQINITDYADSESILEELGEVKDLLYSLKKEPEIELSTLSKSVQKFYIIEIFHHFLFLSFNSMINRELLFNYLERFGIFL